MKVTITAKNYKPSDRLEGNIEKKFDKLEKYFDENVSANVLISKFKEDKTKIEATIVTKHAIFRAEEIAGNVYDALDAVLEKLSNQMSKFKGKLETRFKGHDSLRFEYIPDYDEDDEDEELTVVKRKQYELQPMNYEEAILQMEMLGHDFFVYLDMDTDSVNVVYKRKGDAYGLIETVR